MRRSRPIRELALKLPRRRTRPERGPRGAPPLLGAASVGLALLAIILAWSPGLIAAAFPLTALGFVIGVASRSLAELSRDRRSGIPVAGAMFNAIALSLGLTLGWHYGGARAVLEGQMLRRAAPPADEPAAIAALRMTQLGDPDAGVRSAAAAALGDFGSHDALPRLVQLVGDADDAVRQAALAALDRLVPPTA